jgi:hypothetical protein
MYSLKKLIWLAFIVVAGLLICITLLGVYQYQMTRQYNRVINQNERVLFHFMTIRESLTEALIASDWQGLDRIVPDLEKFNSELSRLRDNRLVSAELKLALVDKIDLAGVVILLRQVASGENKSGKNKKLQEQMRSIADYLIQYDRIIVGQARAGIVNFQKIVIGALGLIISLASFSLILLYRNTVSPLLQLSQQIQSSTIISDGISLGQPMSKEIADLADAIHQLTLQANSGFQGSQSNMNEIEMILAETINETTNQLNGVINYAQLLYDSGDSSGISEEQSEMLQKIIDSGVSIAKEWQKLS